MNISHQTLEVMRFAAADPAVTHVLKVGSGPRPLACCPHAPWHAAGQSRPVALASPHMRPALGAAAAQSWRAPQATCMPCIVGRRMGEAGRPQSAGPGPPPAPQVDDDSYVHFDRLLHRLNSLPRCGRLFVPVCPHPLLNGMGAPAACISLPPSPFSGMRGAAAPCMSSPAHAPCLFPASSLRTCVQKQRAAVLGAHRVPGRQAAAQPRQPVVRVAIAAAAVCLSGLVALLPPAWMLCRGRTVPCPWAAACPFAPDPHLHTVYCGCRLCIVSAACAGT